MLIGSPRGSGPALDLMDACSRNSHNPASALIFRPARHKKCALAFISTRILGRIETFFEGGTSPYELDIVTLTSHQNFASWGVMEGFTFVHEPDLTGFSSNHFREAKTLNSEARRLVRDGRTISDHGGWIEISMVNRW